MGEEGSEGMWRHTSHVYIPVQVNSTRVHETLYLSSVCAQTHVQCKNMCPVKKFPSTMPIHVHVHVCCCCESLCMHVDLLGTSSLLSLLLVLCLLAALYLTMCTCMYVFACYGEIASVLFRFEMRHVPSAVITMTDSSSAVSFTVCGVALL